MASKRDGGASALQRALDAAQRNALIEHARANPDLTLGELVKLRGAGAIAKTLTIGELRGGSTKTRRMKSTGAAAPSVNTRTAAGRKRYDDAVLEALGKAKGPMSSTQLRKIVGGTPLQFRTSIDRHIEAGRVTYEGRARGTKYSRA